jgi:hypothetical protein
MNFKLYLEIFGSFFYSVPSDKEKQMYDFYMLANLRGVENKRNIIQFGGVAGNKPYYEPGGFDPGELETEEKQLDYMLEEVSDKLLPYLKEEFLKVLLEAISGEVADSLYFNEPYILELMIEKESPSESESFKTFMQKLVDYMGPVEDRYEDEDEKYSDLDKWNRYTPNYETGLDHKSRKRRAPGFNADTFGLFKKKIDGSKASQIAQECFPNIDSFIRIAKIIFLEADWMENYGGNNWATITSAYTKLKYASGKNQLIIAIDHVYDLQHNTGTIFTKNPSYAKESKITASKGIFGQPFRKTLEPNYTWIQRALDFKRDLKSVRDLLGKVSSGMKTLALRIIKNKNIR